VGVPCPDCNADDPPRLPEGWTSIARVATDPGFPVNCPTCRALLEYVRTDGATQIYRCFRDGLFLLPPDGVVKAMTQ
jgi:LSD1 subclass zinc finger protein